MAERLMFWLTVRGLLLTTVLALAGGYLLVVHRAHLGIILAYAALLACPVMHFFMHRHGQGQAQGDIGHSTALPNGAAPGTHSEPRDAVPR